MYKYRPAEHETHHADIHCQDRNLYIPLDPRNHHYQEVLDAIIKDGAKAFNGSIPAELQAAADAKKKEL